GCFGSIFRKRPTGRRPRIGSRRRSPVTRRCCGGPSGLRPEPPRNPRLRSTLHLPWGFSAPADGWSAVMSPYRVGYLVGSLAKGSINRKLARALARLAPETLRLEEIPFGDLPLYSWDFDADYPKAARDFKAAIAA